MHAGLFLALESDAGAGGLCEAVDVISFDPETLLDALAHFLGPRLCSENTGFEFVVLRFVAALRKGFAQICRIGRGAAQDRCIQVEHELDLAFCIAGRQWKCQAAYLVGTAVETGAAGEEAVTVRDLNDIFVGSACSYDRPGAALFPHVDVFLGIECDNALAGGAGSGLDADAVLEVSPQKSIGIRYAQVFFAEERELFDVVYTLYVLGLYSLFVHEIPIVGDVVIDVLHLLNDLLVLDLKDFLPGRGLDLFLIIVLHFVGSFPFLKNAAGQHLADQMLRVQVGGYPEILNNCNKKGAALLKCHTFCERIC